MNLASDVRVKGQKQIHFMAGRGDGDFVDLGKTLTNVHKCFIFGFREYEVKVERCAEADHHKHQEGKGLELLLHKHKNT